MNQKIICFNHLFRRDTIWNIKQEKTNLVANIIKGFMHLVIFVVLIVEFLQNLFLNRIKWLNEKFIKKEFFLIFQISFSEVKRHTDITSWKNCEIHMLIWVLTNQNLKRLL